MEKQKILTWTPAVIFLVFICALLWGSAFPALKAGFSSLGIESSTGGKLHFAAVRFFLAGLMVFVGVALTGREIKLPAKKDFLTVCLIGLLQITIQYAFFYIGLSNSTGVKSAVIASSGSFFLAGFSHLWIAGDRLNIKKGIGLICGFFGVILVNVQKGGFSWEFRFLGEGFIILAVMVSAIAGLVVKKSSARIHPPLLAAYQLTLGGMMLFLIALIFEPPTVIHLSKPDLLLLFYLSFVSAAAFSLWYVLIKYNQLTNIAVYRFLIPVCGTLLSAALIDSESLNSVILLSLGLVSGGIVLTSKK